MCSDIMRIVTRINQENGGSPLTEFDLWDFYDAHFYEILEAWLELQEQQSAEEAKQ